MGFFDELSARAAEINSLLCVGLDPHAEDVEKTSRLANISDPAKAAAEFCFRLIAQTKHVAAAYKANSAFFEALGPAGVQALNDVVAKLNEEKIPCILDAKRGDISSTAKAYATSAFGVTQAGCITLHPYMGYDSVKPFLDMDSTKGCFIVCKTSNPSSSDFETLVLQSGKKVYEVVANTCADWNRGSNAIGLVIGATDVEAVASARKHAKDLWILAPGVGFQGGNLEETARAGLREDGSGLLVPVSRGIARADDPKATAEKFRDQINEVRKAKGTAMSSIKNYQKQFFQLALDCGVLKFGSFTLKSGRQSPYFFNAGLFNTGKALAQLAECYAETIVESGVKFDVLFGPAYKGIPLATAISMALYQKFGKSVDVAYNRKEAKDHGEKGMLVGASVENKTVFIVDDVITAGTAIREAMSLLKGASASVVGVAVALDRQEKASETVNQSAIQKVKEDFGITVCSIAGLEHLLAFLQGSKDLGQGALEDVKAYQQRYAVEA